MNPDGEDHTGRVPLPGFGDPVPPGPPATARRDGIRHARRMSNWTLAALIAGTGAATVALAHNALPAGTTAGTTAGTASTATGAGGAAVTNGHSPQVSHAVATTSGSGVTTTTTTHTVNGKVVITRVRHSGYHDN
jgi:hypothetical protein